MQAEAKLVQTNSGPGSVRNIFAFLILAFLFSWTLWVMAIQRGASTAFPLTNLLYLAGVFGPSVAGATMVSLVYSSSKRETFLHRIYTIPKEGLRPVAISVIMVPTLVFLARITSGILGLGNPVALFGDLVGASPTNLVRILFFTLLLGPVSEEPGWRGFLTDSLAGRFAFSKTAGLTGLVWGIWHLPLFFIPGSGQHAMGLFTLGFFVFFATPVVFSFLLLILYLRTGGSIAAAILVHFSINLSLVVFPLNSAGYGIFTLFLAGFVLLLYRANLCPGKSFCSCAM